MWLPGIYGAHKGIRVKLRGDIGMKVKDEPQNIEYRTAEPQKLTARMKSLFKKSLIIQHLADWSQDFVFAVRP